VGPGQEKTGAARSRPGHVILAAIAFRDLSSVAFRRPDFRKNYAQDAVFQFGFDAFDIDVDWQSDRAHELAVAEFMAIERIFPPARFGASIPIR
jgi:hypothetical protein